MYGNGQGISNYQRTKVVTSDPGKLVLLCYEGAISHLQMAKDHFKEKEYEAAEKPVRRTIYILHEMLQNLDFQKRGEIAKSLSALYTYMIHRIMQGDINKDLQAFDEVIGILKEMEEAWRVVCNDARNAATPPMRPPVAPAEPDTAKTAVNAWRA